MGEINSETLQGTLLSIENILYLDSGGSYTVLSICKKSLNSSLAGAVLEYM